MASSSASECELQFDPMDVLVEDAVSLESGELIHDFIDTLLAPRLPDLDDRELSVSLPVDVPYGHRAGAALGKRHKPDVVIGSPVSTMDMPADFSPSGKYVSPKYSPPSPSSGHASPAATGLSRKNKPQRCSICKECGHKSRTCRFAQGKVEVPVPPVEAMSIGQSLA